MSFRSRGSMPATVTVSREPDRSGNFVCDGTTDNVQIQAALDYLTAGRTWKEKVVLKGDFEVSASIVIPSYTTLVIDGKITAADNLDSRILWADVETDIDVFGGLLDGNKANQAAGQGIYFRDVENVRIFGVHVYNVVGEGIKILRDSKRVEIADCILEGMGENSIFIGGGAGFEVSDFVVRNNLFIDQAAAVDKAHVFIVYADGGVVSGNVIRDGTGQGLKMENSVYNINFIDNIINNITRPGVVLGGVEPMENVNIIGNIINTTGGTDNVAGIQIVVAVGDIDLVKYINVEGNIVLLSSGSGIALLGTYSNIVGNIIIDSGTRAGTTYQGITVTGKHINIQDNILDNPSKVIDEGIRISDGYGSTFITVKNNKIISGFTDLFVDGGTDTRLATVHCQLTQAVGGAALKDGAWAAPNGVDVDAATEGAVGTVWLPPEVQQVVRINIYGWSNVIEATNNMLLNVYIVGGSSSEQWNAESIDVGDVPSEETGGILVNDVLHWVIDAADDANIDDLIGGDLLHCAAVGEGASAPDIATDAVFGDCIIEYV